VDPNRLCSDPVPGSNVHSYPAPRSEQDSNKFGSGSDLNLSNFLNISYNKCKTDIFGTLSSIKLFQSQLYIFKLYVL